MAKHHEVVRVHRDRHEVADPDVSDSSEQAMLDADQIREAVTVAAMLLAAGAGGGPSWAMGDIDLIAKWQPMPPLGKR